MTIEQKIDEIINKQFSIDSKYGSYIYHLTRAKEAFEVGTMTFDDFTEIEHGDEWLDQLRAEIKKLLKAQIEELKEEQLHKWKRAKIEIDSIQCNCGEPWNDSDLADLIDENINKLK